MKGALITAALVPLAIGLLPAVAATADPDSGVTSESALAGHHLTWQLSPTGVTARFRGLSAVSRQVAWVGGSVGTVLRTTDGGRSWGNVSPPGVTDLQFRDVQAFDANNALILAIGPGDASRIF